MNPVKQLTDFGQAVWLDYIHRDLMTSGQLKHLIGEDGLRGMTSNPTIFRKALADESAYEDDIQRLTQQGKSAKEIFEALAVKDVQMAADVFRPLYDRTRGEHGYVSLEVNPHLARQTQPTVEEARRLWKEVARPNTFIKVPGTAEGLPAIKQLVSEGINVNVTLLFGLPRYSAVADAFIAGIENRLQNNQPVDRVRSVASFFLSRIDVLLDPKIEAFMNKGGDKAAIAKQLHGEMAVASAKAAYQIYQETVSGERWKKLAVKGAVPQWLLWASTSTKNPDYSDVKYVEPLIGPETVNTMPLETLEAYRDHGHPQPRIGENLEHARTMLAQLPRLGLDIDEATQQLEEEGIEKFCKPFDALLEILEKEKAAA
jgi:transaldolase